MKTKKAKVNLETNRVQLLNEKNSLVTKKEELQTKIATLNVAGPFNVLVHRYQDLLLKST